MNNHVKRVLALVLVGCTPLSAAQDHVVGRGQVEAALQAARTCRERSLARIEGVLETPAVRDAAGRLGVNIPYLRRSLAVLDDAEVEDLASRVRALSLDPVAGQVSGNPPQANTNPLRLLALIGIFLVVFLVIAIVIALSIPD